MVDSPGALVIGPAREQRVEGIHDLGGMSGFGAVEVERAEPVFHERWERRAFGLNTLGLAVLRAYNVHEYRHAVERMEPAHYLAASYYERWFTAVASLLVEKGIVTREELERRAGGRVPLSRPGASITATDACATRAEAPARFTIGAGVRVRDMRTRGHTRAPRYVHGKRGVIVRIAPAFLLPDLAGHGQRAPHEWTYQVEFPATELWGGEGRRGDTVVVDLWESYLEADA
jgi:nitrile hydratase